MITLTHIAAFRDTDTLEKARHGRYADTAANRRLHRVGQEYGSKKQEDSESEKKPQAQQETEQPKKERSSDSVKRELELLEEHKDSIVEKYGEKAYNKKVESLKKEGEDFEQKETVKELKERADKEDADKVMKEEEEKSKKKQETSESKKGAITFEDIKEAVDSREPQELRLAIEGFSLEDKSYEELDEIQEFAKKKGDSLVDSDNYYTSRTGEELLSLHRKIYKKLYEDPQELRGRVVDNTQSMAKEGTGKKSKKEKPVRATTKDKFRNQLWKMEDLAEDTEALAEALGVDAEEDEQYLSEVWAIFDDVVDAVYDTIKDIGDKDALDFDDMTKKVVDSVKEIAKGKPDYLTNSEFFNNWSDMFMVFEEIWNASVKKPFPIKFSKYLIE